MSGSFQAPGAAYIAKSLFVFIAFNTDAQSTSYPCKCECVDVSVCVEMDEDVNVVSGR